MRKTHTLWLDLDGERCAWAMLVGPWEVCELKPRPDGERIWDPWWILGVDLLLPFLQKDKRVTLTLPTKLVEPPLSKKSCATLGAPQKTIRLVASDSRQKVACGTSKGPRSLEPVQQGSLQDFNARASCQSRRFELALKVQERRRAFYVSCVRRDEPPGLPLDVVATLRVREWRCYGPTLLSSSPSEP